MAQLNRDQLNSGVTADSKAVTYEGRAAYSAGYAKRKGRSAPIDLKKTGAFHSGIYARVGRGDITHGSRDSKESLLVEKSGETIFGLNDESLEVLKPQAEEQLIANIKNKLGI